MRGPGATPRSSRWRPSRSGVGARVLHAERARAVEEPVHRRAVEGAGASVAVGAAEAHQQFEVDAAGEAAERAVAHRVLRLVERARPQVLGGDRQHLAAHVEAVERVDVEAVEHAVAGATPAASWPGERQRPSMTAVVAGLPRSWQTAPSMMVARRGRSRSRVAPARLVDDHQRVRPDVAFGMPLGILRAVVERHHLRAASAR